MVRAPFVSLPSPSLHCLSFTLPSLVLIIFNRTPPITHPPHLHSNTTLGCNVSSCSLVPGDSSPFLHHNTPDTSACPCHSLTSHYRESLPANRANNNKNSSDYGSFNSYGTSLYSHDSHTIDCPSSAYPTVGFREDQTSSRWLLSTQVHHRNRSSCCCRGGGRHIDNVPIVCSEIRL